MSVLHRPDKIDSRQSFRHYVDSMLRSLEQALANPAVPYGPAVDDQGVQWESTRLDHFLEAMHAWMTDTGWTAIDQRASPVWAAIDVTEPIGEDEDALREHLARLRDWASNADLPAHQKWREAAEALRAGRASE